MVPIFGLNLFRIVLLYTLERLYLRRAPGLLHTTTCGRGGTELLMSFRLKYRHYLNDQVCDAGLLLRCVSDGKSAGMVAWDAVG